MTDVCRQFACTAWVVIFAVGASVNVITAAESISPPERLAADRVPSQTFNVLDYGAIADGRSINTNAIRKAINACAAAGGGRVWLPAGTYLTGPIVLKSGIDLHVAEGATI